MRTLSVFFALSLLLTSCGCFTFDNPEFRGDEKISVEKVNGSTIEFNAQAKVYNPNCYTLKVKKSTLDLYVEDQYVGKVHLNKKVKMKRKRESTLDADLTAELAQGTLMRMMQYASQESIKVQLKGKVKGGVFIFSKKFEIDETKTIPGASFKIGG